MSAVASQQQGMIVDSPGPMVIHGAIPTGGQHRTNQTMPATKTVSRSGRTMDSGMTLSVLSHCIMLVRRVLDIYKYE